MARNEIPPRRGTGRSRRRSFGSLGAILGAGLLMLGLVIPALAVHDENFQLDGNTADNTAGPAYDWESLFTDSTPATVGGVTTNLVGNFIDADFVTDWRQNATTGAFDTSDGTTFATGSKDTLEIDTGWACVASNNVNNKTDITNAYAAIEEDADSRILYFGLEKGEDNGNNNVGLWLLQNDVSCPANSAPPGTDFSGVHADGDLFIVAAFTNGGGVSNIRAYAWSTALGGINPTPVASSADCQVTVIDDRLCATTNAEITNGTEFEPAWTHFSSKYGVNNGLEFATFFEGGINLTGFNQFRNSCFTGFIFNTRSSQELGATLFDYAQGDIDTCQPELTLDKEPENQTHNVGTSFDWTIEVTNSGDGPADNVVVTDTIPDGLTINSVTVDPLAAGTCDVTGQDIECTLDVAASDGNTDAPEPDVVTITVNVTSTLDVFGESTAGCISVNNTASVTVLDGESTGTDNTDTVAAQICRPLVEKTADGSYTHDVQWEITKDVDIDQHTMNAGEDADSTYTVTATKTVQNSDFAVDGTITITNPNPEDSMTVDVTDELSSGETLAATAIDCPGTEDGDNLVIAADSSVECSYSIAPQDADAGTNTATVTLNSIDFTDDAAYTFTATNTGEPETVNVTDDFDGADTALGEISSTTTFDDYTHNFACSTDETLYTDGHYEYSKTNTASIDETIGDSDSETVDVDCYIPTISKTADGSYTHDVQWEITKDVDIDQHTMNAGEDADSTYTVTATKTVQNSDFAVDGTITITNPNPEDSMTVDVTDELSSGETLAATAIDCPGTEDGDNLVIAADSSVECSYSIAPQDADAGTNTATATFSSNAAVAVSDDAAYTFTATNTGEPETVNVTDDFDGADTALGEISSTTTFDDYTHNFACSTDETLYTDGHYEYSKTNTASIDETIGDSDSETVDVDCYIPTISKTADGSFDRDWDWTIEKVGDESNLNLALGQSFLVNYDVTVDPTATDSSFEVTGSITVTNPNPEDAMTVDVTDVLSSGESLAAVAIDCGAAGDGDDAVIAADSWITCTYDFSDIASVVDGDIGTNTATATFSADAAVAVSDDDGYAFTLDSETDECIDVSDTLGGDFGTVCADADPADFVFEYTYDVVQNECGEHTVSNIASFETNDQDGEADDTGSADWDVVVTIECQVGCTLTQGYWKTHSEYGPAPYDETWALLDALEFLDGPDADALPDLWAGDGTFDGADEIFFLSGQTWYQVFWTAPKGNAYYILAKQYMAAKLNILNGADSPQNVDDAIAAAEALFEQYTPAQIGALKGGKQPRPQFISLAGLLASYNEGAIGPGHCDEDQLSSSVQ